MLNFNTKRRRIIASFFCFSFSLVLIISCAPPPAVVTGAKIASNVSTVIELIDSSGKILSFASNLVNRYYRELGEDIRSGENAVSEIDQITKRMESRHAELSSQHDELDDSLEKTNKAADKLFSMLKKRAKQNTRPELKEKLLSDIDDTERQFTEKIDVAENASLKLEESIKEYDNILNVFQVSGGLRKAQEYIVTVDSVISQYENLNREVQIALDEGKQLITNISDGRSPGETPVVAPTKESATDQSPPDTDSNSSDLADGEEEAARSDVTDRPEKAVVEYYQLISQRQYSSSWAMLSSRFNELRPENNYNDYQEWWNKVDSIRITSIQLIEKSDSDAVVDAELEYSLKDGRQLDDPSRFTLVLDSNGKWLIDDKKKLGN